MARPNDSAVVLYLRVKRSEKREVGQASGGASAARSEAEIVSEIARLFQPPAIDAERAEAIVRRDARPPPVFIPAPRRLPQGGADTPPPLSMDDILYLGKSICKALVDVLDHHPAAPETTPIKTYTPAMDLNPEQITVTPRSPSVLARACRGHSPARRPPTTCLHPRTQAASAGGSRHPTSPQHGRHHVSRQEHLQGPGGRPRPSSCRARDHPY